MKEEICQIKAPEESVHFSDCSQEIITEDATFQKLQKEIDDVINLWNSRKTTMRQKEGLSQEYNEKLDEFLNYWILSSWNVFGNRLKKFQYQMISEQVVYLFERETDKFIHDMLDGRLSNFPLKTLSWTSIFNVTELPRFYQSYENAVDDFVEDCSRGLSDFINICLHGNNTEEWTFYENLQAIKTHSVFCNTRRMIENLQFAPEGNPSIILILYLYNRLQRYKADNLFGGNSYRL